MKSTRILYYNIASRAAAKHGSFITEKTRNRKCREGVRERERERACVCIKGDGVEIEKEKLNTGRGYGRSAEWMDGG